MTFFPGKHFPRTRLTNVEVQTSVWSTTSNTTTGKREESKHSFVGSVTISSGRPRPCPLFLVAEALPLPLPHYKWPALSPLAMGLLDNMLHNTAGTGRLAGSVLRWPRRQTRSLKHWSNTTATTQQKNARGGRRNKKKRTCTVVLCNSMFSRWWTPTTVLSAFGLPQTLHTRIKINEQERWLLLSVSQCGVQRVQIPNALSQFSRFKIDFYWNEETEFTCRFFFLSSLCELAFYC